MNELSSDVTSHISETLLWLCSIASPIGDEEALCDAVSERIERLTLAGKTRRYLNSIVVPVTRSNERRPRVALVGHLDTVRTENGPARIDGDRLYGSGASDMKSGLALMLALIEKEDLRSLPCDLTLVFYSREEGPFVENELGPVLEADPELAHIDLGVCLEPSDNRLHLGCMGSIHATATFVGKTAHSARPWEGVNAVYQAAEFLRELSELKPTEVRIDNLLYRAMTTVTQAKDGGRGRNIVPDQFVLNLNHRFAPGTTIDEARQHVLSLVRDRAEIVFTDLSPAAAPNGSHPLVQSLIRAGVRSVEPKHAWTDVARFAARGIAAVNFGPGENAQAHQKNESTSLALVHEGYAILRRWLMSIGAAS